MQIALSLVNGIGPARAERLFERFDTAEEILQQSPREISETCDININMANTIVSQFSQAIKNANEEFFNIRSKGIKTLFFTDPDYPFRLRECTGFPLVLYYKGEADFNNKKYVSIVGTRRATEYGKRLCTKFVEDLAAYSKDIVIISGLAYGIDITAHRAALASGLKTYGIIGSGFNQFYPSAHLTTAQTMIAEGGGVITELTSNISPLPENFAKRNRIIAGMGDATIVIESALNGGSLITAKQALSYGRELYAFPGRVGERLSAGCNNYIKYDKAHLIENADDFLYFMGWNNNTLGRSKDIPLEYLNLSPDETIIYEAIEKEKKIHRDTLELYYGGKIDITTILINMEIKGIVEHLPGNFYSLI